MVDFRFPTIKAVLINISKRANRLDSRREDFIPKAKTLLSKLEGVSQSLKELIEEKEKDNAEEV